MRDLTVSRRGKWEPGKWEPGKAERMLESECDRQAEEEESREEKRGGRAGVGEMWVESKPPSSPDSSVKDTVLKRWIACALSAKACPRQWHHHHHQTSKDTRREPQTHAWIFYSLLFTHLFIILLSLRLYLFALTRILKSSYLKSH